MHWRRHGAGFRDQAGTPMTKFYQLSKNQRLKHLQAAGHLTSDMADLMAADAPLPADIADSMIENQLTQYLLPEGIVLDVCIDQKRYQIPLVTEEPSVIAAANNAAKLISNNGGFHTTVQRGGVIGQVVFAQVPEPGQKVQLLRQKSAAIAEIARTAYPSIYRRGGGVRSQTVTQVGRDFVKLELLIDTKAAMGANMVNRICEAVGKQAAVWLAQAPILAILSNHAPQDVTTARVSLPTSVLAKGDADGETVAQRIVLATEFAQQDIGRAVTHNKGIMNGLMGVVQAYGNDTRAISAGIHSYASLSGSYQPLSAWTITKGNLEGRLSVPLPIGAVGGSIGIVPLAQANQRLGQAQSPEVMQSQMAAIGLASNLAALRALVTDGIQQGHMQLQYKSLAIGAGAKGAEIDWLQTQLMQHTQVSLKLAQQLLQTKREQEL